MFYRDLILHEESEPTGIRKGLLKSVERFFKTKTDALVQSTDTYVSITDEHCDSDNAFKYIQWMNELRDSLNTHSRYVIAKKGDYDYPMIKGVPCYYTITGDKNGNIKFGFMIYSWEPDSVIERTMPG